MSISGTYVLESAENYEALLTAMGLPEDKIKFMLGEKPTMEMCLTGDQLTVNVKAETGDYSNTITSGKESTLSMPGGLEIKVNMVAADNTLKGTANLMGKEVCCSSVFTEAGSTQTLTACNVTATRIYKRK